MLDRQFNIFHICICSGPPPGPSSLQIWRGSNILEALNTNIHVTLRNCLSSFLIIIGEPAYFLVLLSLIICIATKEFCWSRSEKWQNDTTKGMFYVLLNLWMGSASPPPPSGCQLVTCNNVKTKYRVKSSKHCLGCGWGDNENRWSRL